MLTPTSPPTLIARMRALPGAAEDVARLLSDLTVSVRDEPGNVIFNAHRLASNGDDFVVYEVYEDAAAFAAHMASAHGKAFNDAIRTRVIGGASELSWLDTVLPTVS